MIDMKIEELKKKYEGEWLAIEVTKEEDGEPKGGKLLLHKKDRKRKSLLDMN
ncbi:MAG: hypothetical protein ACQESD_07775 [Thermoplasmatota archaeon]